ncbi:MAG: glutathione S-transferase family protein [SAR324 cluster bacterium]|nr:glutathione S-transferase family protein [SAR324 cluster bacterium]
MTDLSLVIGNKNYSSWSFRPWFLLKHFKIDFEEIPILLSQENTKDILAPYSPSLKVPVLIHQDLTIWDSLAICEYASEVFLAGKAWPSASDDRAFARSVSAEMHSGFFSIRSEMPMNCRRQIKNFKPSSEADIEITRVAKIWNQCRNRYAASGPWLFGKFSIADAMFGPVALRFSSYGIELDKVGNGYVKTVLSHPDTIAWVEASKLETAVIPCEEVGD